jgi:hypothetical protein
MTLQATKDARCTKTYKKSGASHSTKLLTDLSSKKSVLTIIINFHLSTQIKPQHQRPSPHKPHTHKYLGKNSSHQWQTNYQRELKTLLNQLLNQNSMILSLLNTGISRITTTA